MCIYTVKVIVQRVHCLALIGTCRVVWDTWCGTRNSVSIHLVCIEPLWWGEDDSFSVARIYTKIDCGTTWGCGVGTA